MHELNLSMLVPVDRHRVSITFVCRSCRIVTDMEEPIELLVLRQNVLNFVGRDFPIIPVSDLLEDIEFLRSLDDDAVRVPVIPDGILELVERKHLAFLEYDDLTHSGGHPCI